MLKEGSRNRPGTWIQDIRGIVIHGTAVPDQRAADVKAFWQGGTRDGAAHRIVDFDGAVHMAIPDQEVAWHCGSSTGYTHLKDIWIGRNLNPNEYLLGIETCIVDIGWRMTGETWQGLRVQLAEWCNLYNLSTLQIWTHQMMVGDQPHWRGWKCHQYFYDNPDELERLRFEVGREMRKLS